jgi:cytochrome c oxidase subunit 2
VRRGSIVQLVVIGIVSGAIATCIAVLVPWMPTTATDQAERIDFTYWFATVISLFVFAVVAAILIYALLNFRVKDPNDWSDGPPIHGHTTLEVIWTVVPTILVTAICIVSAVVLAQNSNAGDAPLKVNVVAQQFAWQFSYDGGKTYYPMLRLPVDRKTKLYLKANDVLHSFWVPQFAQKQDLVPGTEQTLVITPNQTGSWPVICTELCGLGHSLMRSQAIVMTKAEFDTWRENANKPPAGGGEGGGGGAASAEATFASKGCGACHTFSAIPAAQGKIGPDLDNLKEAAETAGMPLEDFIRQSIVDPNAYLAPGFNPPSAMPPFKDTIPPADLDALVQYLAENTN